MVRGRDCPRLQLVGVLHGLRGVLTTDRIDRAVDPDSDTQGIVSSGIPQDPEGRQRRSRVSKAGQHRFRGRGRPPKSDVLQRDADRIRRVAADIVVIFSAFCELHAVSLDVWRRKHRRVMSILPPGGELVRALSGRADVDGMFPGRFVLPGPMTREPSTRGGRPRRDPAVTVGCFAVAESIRLLLAGRAKSWRRQAEARVYDAYRQLRAAWAGKADLVASEQRYAKAVRMLRRTPAHADGLPPAPAVRSAERLALDALRIAGVGNSKTAQAVREVFRRKGNAAPPRINAEMADFVRAFVAYRIGLDS